MLAMGFVDVIMEGAFKRWDVAALFPLVEGAGGIITAWEGGDCRDGKTILACGDPHSQEAIKPFWQKLTLPDTCPKQRENRDAGFCRRICGVFAQSCRNLPLFACTKLAAQITFSYSKQPIPLGGHHVSARYHTSNDDPIVLNTERGQWRRAGRFPHGQSGRTRTQQHAQDWAAWLSP